MTDLAAIVAEYGADAKVFSLTPTQATFWTCQDRYQNLEGAVRSGKTTVCLLKVGHRCEQYAGLHAMISRWKQEDTDAQLRARFVELFGGRCQWNAREQYFEFPNMSRVYVRGLKPSEGASLFSKFAGLTLAIGYWDQPEEFPKEIFEAMKARLSQPGFPHELYLSPNPPDEDHWLCEEFPLPDSHAENVLCRPGYRYIRTTVYDNASNLDPDYIPQLESDYPAGHVLRRRFIEGRRGLSVVGEPVYRGYFDRKQHVVHEPGDWVTTPSALFDPALPLYESWDFGHSSPCVTWHQVHRGGVQWTILGGVQGRNLFLEDFGPAVLHIRGLWFPVPPPTPDVLAFNRVSRRFQLSGGLNVETVGDPATSNQGISLNAVTVLGDMGIFVMTQSDANRPEQRNYAIQVAGGFMRRAGCFRVSDRFLVLPRDKPPQSRSLLVDALEAGYVWDGLSMARTASPNTRRPKKDGVFDHSMNTCEYAWLRWAPAAPASLAGVFHTDVERQRIKREHERVEHRALRLAQKDQNPFRWRDLERSGGGVSRGGY